MHHIDYLLSPKEVALLRSVLRQFYFNHVDKDDLLQAGRIGILKARKKYDPSWGVPFGGYVRKWVYGEMSRFLRCNSIEPTVNVDKPTADGSKLADTLLADRPPNGLLDQASLQAQDILCSLPEEEAEVLRLYFGFDGDPYTTRQVGKRWGGPIPGYQKQSKKSGKSLQDDA